MERLDLGIDGADEVDPAFRLVKGGGGALLRERVVAAACERFVVVCDSSKAVPVLGAFPLPVEVIAFAAPLVSRVVASLGARPAVRVVAGGAPFVTDEGHWIIDAAFGRLDDPERVAAELRARPGVVDVGLFVGMADRVIIGRGETVESHDRLRNRANR